MLKRYQDALDTTDDFELQSTAGGWAFEDSHPTKSAKVVDLLVDAGLIIMGKANLSVSLPSGSCCNNR